MPVLSAGEVGAYAKAAGFPDNVLAEAIAYAGIESGLNSDAVSPTGCVGLWQICPPPGDAKDPAANARYAFAKWKGCKGGSFSCEWDPYNGGHGNPRFAHYYQLALGAIGSLPTVAQAPPQRTLYGQGVVGQTLTSPWFQGTWEITQGWGPTSYQGEPSGHGYANWHAGVDVGLACGTEIVMPAGLTGTARTFDNPGGYGTAMVVLIDGGPGVVLGHLRQRQVDDGAKLIGGMQLGVSNSTGNSTGCHLHFETRPQDAKKPLGIAAYGGDSDPSSWLLTGGGSSATAMAFNPGQEVSNALGNAVQQVIAGFEVALGVVLVAGGVIAAAYGLRGKSAATLQRDFGRQVRTLRQPRPEPPKPQPPQPTPAAESRVRPDMQRAVPDAGESAQAKLRGGANPSSLNTAEAKWARENPDAVRRALMAANR